MKYHSSKILIIGILSAILCACDGFFDKDNTPPPSPLVNFTPEAKVITLWSTNTHSGIGSEYLKLTPSVSAHWVFTANHNGAITATNKDNGTTNWSINTHLAITAGPTAADGLVFVGSRDGIVLALQQSNGKQLWKNQVTSEILAPPAAANGIVLVKSVDGELTAISEQNGRILWHYQQTEPTLILRSASTPQIQGANIFVGFANGNLAKLTLQEGSLIWQKTIATPQGSFAIQRMVDIDADPVIYKNRAYVATYQGKISAVNLATGNDIWTQDISSYTGIAIDNAKVYVADASSHVWAFDINNGRVAWHQPQLEARNITGPAVLDNYIVVGDAEGYLHWLSKQDGHLVARTKVSSSGILATPIIENNRVYVVAKDGNLAAYRLTS